MRGISRNLLGSVVYLGTFLVLLGCSAGGNNQQCMGPTIDPSVVNARQTAMSASSGTQGYLVVPNPFDATGTTTATMTSQQIYSVAKLLELNDLLSSTRLESNLLKIRIETISDPTSMLAVPDSSGQFKFNIQDVHYWETMGYHSTKTAQNYVEKLGFTLLTSQPLYVMVRAKQAGVSASTVNAFYTHNYLDPSQPRSIKVFGNTSYAPGVDQDVYWHEFGHFVNESVSAEVGMDLAGDYGANYTEAGSLHECLADYLAESLSGRPYIGKWVSQNFKGFNPGDPLRAAYDPGNKLIFGDVGWVSSTGEVPGRYPVGEWCTRVLWDIRSAFVSEDSQYGAIRSDRLIYSALSSITRDTTFSQYQRALSSADGELYCGTHVSAIDGAFGNRGFSSVSSLTSPLQLSATPLAFDASGNQQPAPVAGSQIAFTIRITNPNSTLARNVRLGMESTDSRLQVVTYMQGYGDLPSGRSVQIGSGVNSIDLSVLAKVSSSAAKGTKLPYRLRVLVENGAETTSSGEIQL